MVRLQVWIAKDQHFILEGYYSALNLVDRQQARFSRNDHGDVFVVLAGLTICIQCANDVRVLEKLYVEGVCNVRFSRPTVVLDIGMGVGLEAIFFASQEDTVVIGCEPCRMYDQALRNIALNPTLSNKIQTQEAAWVLRTTERFQGIFHSSMCLLKVVQMLSSLRRNLTFSMKMWQ